MQDARRNFASDEWRNIDQAADPTALVHRMQFRNATRAEGAVRGLRFAALDPQEGNRILDVGCGPGEDALALAPMVGKTGKVVGVDSSEAMITAARKQAVGLDLSVEFQVGSVYRVEFPDNSFDGCQAARVFMHLDDPRRALSEIIRVVRPGGRIVVNDPDVGTRIVDAHGDRALTRRILNCGADSFRNPWIGRRLFGLLCGAGLEDVSAEAFVKVATDPITPAGAGPGLEVCRGMARRAAAAGVVSEAEAASWVASLEEAARAGRYFGSITEFVVGGRKP